MEYVLIAILLGVVVTITCMRNRFVKKDIEMHRGDIPEKKEVEPSEPQPKTEKPISKKRKANTKQAEK